MSHRDSRAISRMTEKEAAAVVKEGGRRKGGSGGRKARIKHQVAGREKGGRWLRMEGGGCTAAAGPAIPACRCD